jgi:calmodulin
MSFNNFNSKEEDNFTDDKIEELHSAFEIFDKDGDGKITFVELQDILKKFGYKENDENLKQILDQVDTNGNGEVEFKDFLELMCLKMKDQDIEDDIMEAFKIFDKDSNGYISSNDLKNIMDNLDEKITQEEIDDLLSTNEKSGSIKFEEFRNMIMK